MTNIMRGEKETTWQLKSRGIKENLGFVYLSLNGFICSYIFCLDIN